MTELVCLRCGGWIGDPPEHSLIGRCTCEKPVPSWDGQHPAVPADPDTKKES